MNKLLSYFAFISIFSSLIGCSAEVNKGRIPSLYDTKAEAEKAAKDFNCTGAHKMGEKWMPCDKHEDHMRHGAHGNHHNH